MDVCKSSILISCIVRGAACAAFVCLAGDAFADSLPAGGLTSPSFSAMEPTSLSSSFMRMAGALFLCLGMFAAGIHVYRRYAVPLGGTSKRRLLIREKLPLSSKTSLMVVAFDGKEYLIASGTERVSLLGAPPGGHLEFRDSLQEACEGTEVFDV